MPMKKVLFFLLFTLCIEAGNTKQVLCAVPQSIAEDMSPLFRTAIAYTQMKVKLKSYADNKQSLQALADKEVKFAIVRSDILHALTQDTFHWPKLKDIYITLSTLPFSAQLYYVQSGVLYDIDLVDLQERVVSVGAMGDANAYVLKDLLGHYGLRHAIHYKSLDYKTSLQAIEDNTLDGYFGFLPKSFENDSYHFQSLFSDESMQYVKAQNIFSVNYEGISVSYTLLASKDASDEEIENVIYRLEEKKMFSPQTDENFGPVNLYVLEHLAQIQDALDVQASQLNKNVAKTTVLSQVCLDYHYGFLDLLRRKPALKKRVRGLKRKGLTVYKVAKNELKEIENILLTIDAKKKVCDLSFIKNKKNVFLKIAHKINHL